MSSKPGTALPVSHLLPAFTDRKESPLTSRTLELIPSDLLMLSQVRTRTGAARGTMKTEAEKPREL